MAKSNALSDVEAPDITRTYALASVQLIAQHSRLNRDAAAFLPANQAKVAPLKAIKGFHRI
jgi:hypothetical protein